MSERREDGLETWIIDWFQRKQIVQEEQAVARRYFLREFDQVQADDGIDVLKERLTIMDPDSPDLGHYGEWVEGQAGASLICYRQAMAEGHGSPYSEVYGYLAGSDGNATERASSEAYQTINQGSVSGPESPGYHDAYQACIFQRKDTGFARRCADHLIEESCSFEEAFQVAAEFEKAYQRMLGKGHSELRSTMYAQAIREVYVPQFAEVFARSAEEQMVAGRTRDEAERFARIYTDLFDAHGSFDEDCEYHDLANEHCMALAEAAYRYRPEFGDKEKFIDAFDQIYQKVSDSPRAGSREWFDEVEAGALQRIAAKDAYMAEHGNLRGFEIEEKEELSAEPAPPKAPNFRTMSEDAFQAFRPKSEDEDEDYREEAKYRDWCEEMECDPTDSESRDEYKQQQEGDSWDDMDENDRDGWTDNMNKD